MRYLYIRRLVILASLAILSFVTANSQNAPAPPAGRSALLKANEAKLLFPLFKGSTNMGVMPVPDITMPYTNGQKTKIVFDLSQPTKDPSKGLTNEGIEEIMRILNLHVAAGVKPENLDVYIVFHGPAASSFLVDEKYNKQFNINNPNLALVQQLSEKGVKMVVCGQTVALRNLDMKAFPPVVMKSLSARSALTDLQSRGYVLYDIAGE
jgi:intracellular sulfur oxidation DsrE/DsrF family protein